MSNSSCSPQSLQPRNDMATTSLPPSSTSATQTHKPATTPPRDVFHRVRITYQRASEIISWTHLHPKLPLTAVFALLGIAAEIEQPGFLPRPAELGIGLVAAVCAGGVVFSVVALDRVGEESGWLGEMEGCWGAVWRWVRDGFVWGEMAGVGVGEEERVTMMFAEDGASVFLRDTPQGEGRTTPTWHMSESTPQRASTGTSRRGAPVRSNPNSPVFKCPSVQGLTPMNSPPSPHRQEHAYASSSFTQPLLRQPAPRQACLDPPTFLRDSYLEEEHHASGLLEPSPMPPRRIASHEWKNSTGKGFYKYQQKLEAVKEWSNPGSSRSVKEVMKKTGKKHNGEEDEAEGYHAF